MKTSVHSTSELAERLGLSRWTVSRALNGQPGVNAATAERVRAEARKAGFAPSILGRGLRSGKTDLIGVVVPDLEDYHLTRKISVLRNRIEEAGWHSVFQITDSSSESERDALERLSAIRCAGVIVIGSSLAQSDTGLSRLRSSGTPVVMVDPWEAGGERVVITDRATALNLTFQHLHDTGHRRFGVLGIDSTTPYGKQRMQGIQKACRKFGLNEDRDLDFLVKETDGDDYMVGATLTRQLPLAKKNPPTAIIALNDRMAMGALSMLHEMGLRVPEDISLVGYDNTDFSAFTTPPLTTIDPQSDDLVHSAMDLLLAPESGRRMITPRLIVRQSSSAR